MEAETLKAVAYARNIILRHLVARLRAAAQQPLVLQQPAHLALGILQLLQMQAWHLDLAAPQTLAHVKQ